MKERKSEYTEIHYKLVLNLLMINVLEYFFI